MIARALSLIAIIGIGYLIKRLGWVSVADFPLFSKLVLQVTLPCALITSFNEFDISSSLLVLTLFGFGTGLLHILGGYLRAHHGTAMDKSFAVINTGGLNIGAFATPYISGMIGPSAVVYTSMFDVGNAMTTAGIGYGWGMSLAGRQTRRGLPGFVLQMLQSPVFVTYLFLLIFRGVGWHFPDPILSFTSVVGAANPFMAMLMIGIGLEIQLSASKYLAAAKLLGIRYAISAVLFVVFWWLTPLPRDIAVVICALLFAPMAVMVSGFTAQAGGDVELSTFASTVSILIAIVAIPTVLLTLGG